MKHWIAICLVAVIVSACSDGDGTGRQPLEASLESIDDPLDDPLAVDFHQESLSAVLDDFRNRTRVSIFVPWPALDKAGISPKTPITLQLDAPAREVMKRILDEASKAAPGHEVSFTVSEGILQISEPRASSS